MGKLASFYEKALRCAFGLPIYTAIIGAESMEQLKNNLAVVDNFKRTSDVERLELYKEIIPFVSPERCHEKAVTG